MTVQVWRHQVKLWFRRNWEWFVLSAGLLLIALGIRSRKKPADVASPELSEAAGVAHVEQEKATAAIEEAQAETIALVAEIEEEHAEVVAALDEDQKADVEKLRADPVALSEFLLKVGKDT